MTDDPQAHRLAQLDRRAAAAIEALDDEVGRAPITDFAATPTRKRRRWISAPAIAAGTVVVALIAAVLVFSGGGERSTIAGEVDGTLLVLPDPAALGYRVAAAFDGTEPGADDGISNIPVTIFGPTESDDPWSSALVFYALPAEVTTLGGEPVDVGGPEATFDSEGVGGTVGWADGDQIRYLVSTRVDREPLVDLAGEFVASSGGPESQQELFNGSLSDVFSTLMTSVGPGGAPTSARPTAAVFYASESGDGEAGFAVATSRGSDSLLRASHVLATETTDTKVRDRDAVVAEFLGAEGLLSVSWLESDGTLVRADAFGIDDVELLAHLDRLVAINVATFEQLVADHPVDDSSTGGPQEEVVAGTGDPSFSRILAQVRVTEDEIAYAASVRRAEDGSLTIEIREDGPDSGSASSAPLGSSAGPVVLRHGAADGAVLVAGFLGPDVVDVQIECDGVTRCDFDISGPSTTNLSEPPGVVFLAVLPSAPGTDLTVVGTLADGSELRLEV